MVLSRRLAHLDSILLFVGVLCVYLFTASSDLRHNGDTDLRYQTTQALVDHGRAWIPHPLWTDTRVVTGVGGHLYAFYAPGQAVFMAPLYVAGKVVAHHLHLSYDITTLYAARSLDLWLGAVLVLLLYLLARLIGLSPPAAVLIASVFAFATVAWPDAQSALEQTQVDLFLVASVYAVIRYVRGGLSSRRWLALAGTCVGLCVFTRYDAALYLPVLLAYPLTMRASRRDWRAIASDVLIYALACVPWLAGLALWDTWRFGSPFNTGLREATFGEPFIQGFTGLLLSPGKGLLWYLPVAVLLPFVARDFYRRDRGIAVFFVVLAALPIVLYSNVLYWHGDPAWGPRYLYTSVPYIVLPLGEVFIRWHRVSLSLRTLVVSAVCAGLALSVCAVSVTQWRFWYHLEATLQAGASAERWSGQPFHWGSQHYHYYWHPRQSPILLQPKNVYEVARIGLGEHRYILTVRPDPYVSNPADNYPLNEFGFWWVDSRHPLLGGRTRGALALALAAAALCCFTVLGARLRGAPAAMGRQIGELEAVPGARIGG